MFKIGDTVSVIHDVISGTITKIAGKKISIEDSDGFERQYKSTDLALVSLASYNLDSHEAKQFIAENNDHIKVQKAIPNAKKTSQELKSLSSTEIDLHIEVLMPEAVNWGVGDILQKQMIACRAFVEKAVANKFKRVILIHGKGEGVLKSDIYRYLNRVQDHLHVGVSYHDADYRSFGTGATQVNFSYS